MSCRPVRTLLALLLVLPLTAAAARADWVASWAAATATLAMPGLRDTTVRQVLRLSLGGQQLRVRFTNETGTRPLRIGGAHLSRPGAAPGSIDTGSDRVLTFGGATTALLPPGVPLLSDPVDLAVAPLSRLVVTALFDTTAPVQVGHPVGGETAYLLAGDHTADVVLSGAATATARFALSGVEVSVPGQTSPGIGAIGDSLTDGVGSTPDTDRRWTDRLAERLAGRTGGPIPAVANAGIAGNAVTGGVLTDATGQSALARFDRDVLARPALRWLVLLEGSNDLLGSATPLATAADIVAAHRQIIARAHEHGIKVIGATLPPFGGYVSDAASGQREAARAAVNAWILQGGEFDGTVDFDAVLRDPDRPRRLLAAYDSGDHLHPNDAGYRAMGDAVPLGLFR